MLHFVIYKFMETPRLINKFKEEWWYIDYWPQYYNFTYIEDGDEWILEKGVDKNILWRSNNTWTLSKIDKKDYQHFIAKNEELPPIIDSIIRNDQIDKILE